MDDNALFDFILKHSTTISTPALTHLRHLFSMITGAHQQHLPHDLENLIMYKALGDKDGYLRALREMEAGFAGDRPI